MLGLPQFEGHEIELRNSTLTALVSDEDAEWAEQFTWYLNRRGYAVTWGSEFLHQAVVERAGLTRSGPVDHINRDPLDCQRSNLRIVSWAENAWNRGGWHANAHKGAHPLPSGKWKATIQTNGVRKNLGTFDSAEDAHAAYVRAAVEQRGSLTLTGAN